MKHLTGCPQAAFVVCPGPLLRETKSYEETEETGHLQSQKPHLTTKKSPAEGARMTPEFRSFVEVKQVKALTKWW